MVIFHCCVNVYQRVGLEHGPFIDALPCKDGEFSIANSSNYQMVNPTKSKGEKNVNPLTLLIGPFSILQGYSIHSMF